MKKYFMFMLILLSVCTTLGAKEVLSSGVSEFDVKYLEKMKVDVSALKSKDELSVDVSSSEGGTYEVKLTVNRYFKPFVIIGAKVTELLDSFNLKDLGKGFGANLHISNSLKYYAKYISKSVGDDILLRYNSSAMHVGVEYSF